MNALWGPESKSKTSRFLGHCPAENKRMREQSTASENIPPVEVFELMCWRNHLHKTDRKERIFAVTVHPFFLPRACWRRRDALIRRRIARPRCRDCSSFSGGLSLNLFRTSTSRRARSKPSSASGRNASTIRSIRSIRFRNCALTVIPLPSLGNSAAALSSCLNTRPARSHQPPG